MNHKNAIESALAFIKIILICSLISAFLGGLFAFVIGLISPNLIMNLLDHQRAYQLLRNAFGFGMIWGLFIGAMVSGFACFLGILMEIVRYLTESRKKV